MAVASDQQTLWPQTNRGNENRDHDAEPLSRIGMIALSGRLALDGNRLPEAFVADGEGRYGP
jgi:hypothetical protein